MADKESIVADLTGKSTVKRRKAAKAALAFGREMCGPLLEALRLERGKDYWQTECAVIKAIGSLGCGDAHDELLAIILREGRGQLDIVKYSAGKALVQVSRESLQDASPVFAIADLGNYSATEGALEALGYDRMVPDDQSSEKLIQRMWDFGSDRDKRGLVDPRYGLIAACAGWKPELCRDFLLHCLETGDNPAKYVAEKALKQKYARLR